MTVNIDSETDIDFDFDYERMIRAAVKETADYVSCPYEVEVNVLLVNNEQIHTINKESRDIDRPTDVLSFPMLEYDTPADLSFIDEEASNDFNPDTGELILGDIVISIDKVNEQAYEYGHSNQREITFLTVHSMLHLFGYDHMDEEDKKMEELQKDILEKMNILR